ncbi:prepilin-type N-terminal cleavage/methylation domain-containing protein [Desulfovibrio inopinatus]|uniref:prepilin-type N-terminal cleavage/methylation domain-containing protein n=1 Tax=Desulfovibrio inopinatus TaxID=102109 RepID=UPI000418C0B8|nr:prepilin-type N-terminal cleavage/methylation domain-containing protein [Desulfovibrio inopinatus]
MNAISRNSVSGFTLLETLIAVAVLAIAFVTIVGSLDNMQRSLGRTRDRSQTIELAQRKMLEVAEKGPSSIRETKGRFNDDDLPGATFVIDIKDTTDVDIKRVTVTIDVKNQPNAHVELTRLFLKKSSPKALSIQ